MYLAPFRQGKQLLQNQEREPEVGGMFLHPVQGQPSLIDYTERKSDFKGKNLENQLKFYVILQVYLQI